MLLFDDTGKLKFRDNKLQLIPEGGQGSDCWCCNSNDNCYLCQNPSSPNYGKKFYGGTTTVTGYPDTWTFVNGPTPPFDPGPICGQAYNGWLSLLWTFTDVDTFNMTWTNEPRSPSDCTNMRVLKKVTTFQVRIEYVLNGDGPNPDPCVGEKLTALYQEIDLVWDLWYGYRYADYYQHRTLYACPGWGATFADQSWRSLLSGQYSWTGAFDPYYPVGNLCDYNYGIFSRGSGINSCDPVFEYLVTATPHFLP